MSLFRPRRSERRDANLDALGTILRQYGIAPRGTGTITVTKETALRLSAVWACIGLICDECSTLPIDEYRKGPDGFPVAVDPPSTLLTEPSAFIATITWRYQLFEAMVGGNAYGYLTAYTAQSYPARIELLDPELVSWHRPNKPGGEWETRINNDPVTRWPSGPLWHVPGRTMAGSPIGLSPIKYAMERIRLGLEAEQFGAQWFTDGGVPSAVLSTTTELDEADAKVAKQRFLDAVHGNREPVVLSGDWKYDQIQVSAEESQFLDTISASVADIARFYGIPPEEIGGTSGDAMTYANIEARSLQLRRRLNPWIVRAEHALTAITPQPRYVKLNRDAALSVETNSRYSAHDKALRDGWLSRNDIRRMEDLPPIAGGDEYLWPPYRAFPIEADQRAERTMRIVRDRYGNAVALTSNGADHGPS